jgi:hypothetical protein
MEARFWLSCLLTLADFFSLPSFFEWDGRSSTVAREEKNDPPATFSKRGEREARRKRPKRIPFGEEADDGSKGGWRKLEDGRRSGWIRGDPEEAVGSLEAVKGRSVLGRLRRIELEERPEVTTEGVLLQDDDPSPVHVEDLPPIDGRFLVTFSARSFDAPSPCLPATALSDTTPPIIFAPPPVDNGLPELHPLPEGLVAWLDEPPPRFKKPVQPEEGLGEEGGEVGIEIRGGGNLMAMVGCWVEEASAEGRGWWEAGRGEEGRDEGGEESENEEQEVSSPARRFRKRESDRESSDRFSRQREVEKGEEDDGSESDMADRKEGGLVVWAQAARSFESSLWQQRNSRLAGMRYMGLLDGTWSDAGKGGTRQTIRSKLRGPKGRVRTTYCMLLTVCSRLVAVFYHFGSRFSSRISVSKAGTRSCDGMVVCRWSQEPLAKRSALVPAIKLDSSLKSFAPGGLTTALCWKEARSIPTRAFALLSLQDVCQGKNSGSFVHAFLSRPAVPLAGPSPSRDRLLTDSGGSSKSMVVSSRRMRRKSLQQERCSSKKDDRDM